MLQGFLATWPPQLISTEISLPRGVFACVRVFMCVRVRVRVRVRVPPSLPLSLSPLPPFVSLSVSQCACACTVCTCICTCLCKSTYMYMYLVWVFGGPRMQVCACVSFVQTSANKSSFSVSMIRPLFSRLFDPLFTPFLSTAHS